MLPGEENVCKGISKIIHVRYKTSEARRHKTKENADKKSRIKLFDDISEKARREEDEEEQEEQVENEKRVKKSYKERNKQQENERK